MLLSTILDIQSDLGQMQRLAKFQRKQIVNSTIYHLSKKFY